MTLQRKAFNDIITFSRASNATVTGSDGLIQYAPHNLLTYSQEFDNAAWTKGSSTVTANAAASPDGTVTADKLVEDTSSSGHFAQSVVSVTSTTPYSFSVYAKAGERSKVQLLMAQSTSPFTNHALVTFDLVAGTVFSTVVGTGSITSVGNGWYRLTVFGTASSTGEITRITLADSSGTTAYTGDGTSGIYIWGAQLSVGPRALSYTPTTSAAVYGPRFDYDPVSMAPKGLLIEEQRTNLLTYSEDISNSVWVTYNSTKTANVTSSPDGAITADQITPVGGGGHGVIVYSVLTAGEKSFSVYAKAAGYNFIALGNESEGHYAIFNLASGTVESTSGATVSNAKIQSVGNGWYRVSCIVNTTATKSASVLALQSAGSITYTADGTSGIYVWGAQLEAGAFATSYIPTVASQVTRSADVASVNTLSPWYNATEGTLFAEATLNGSATNRAFSLGSGTDYMYVTGGQNSVVASGVGQANFTNTPSANSTFKTVMAYAANNFAASFSGGTVQTDTSGSVPSGISSAGIGQITTGSSFIGSGWIRRIAYYPRRLTNSELQALTA